MTQTVREQLQALVDEIKAVADKPDHRIGLMQASSVSRFFINRLESILATEPPAVTVRKGWLCKDNSGIWWYSDKPFWDVGCEWWDNNGAMHQLLNGAITDPWPDHPNGGPECVMEVG